MCFLGTGVQDLNFDSGGGEVGCSFSNLFQIPISVGWDVRLGGGGGGGRGS